MSLIILYLVPWFIEHRFMPMQMLKLTHPKLGGWNIFNPWLHKWVAQLDWQNIYNWWLRKCARHVQSSTVELNKISARWVVDIFVQGVSHTCLIVNCMDIPCSWLSLTKQSACQELSLEQNVAGQLTSILIHNFWLKVIDGIIVASSNRYLE